jgi:DNA repair photolyase
MPLKKSTGNMYSFVTHTWNPVRGKCPYNCSYCYVGRWGEQQPIHLDEKELKTDLGSGNFIFVCSGCDLFHPDIPLEWILRVIQKTGEYPLNTYLWHTKNPERASIYESRMPASSILCTTIETNRNLYPLMGQAPTPSIRAFYAGQWKGQKMITVEPIMDFDNREFVEMIKMVSPFQVNIGADSGSNGLPEPSKEKIIEFVSELETFTKAVKKKNLERLLLGLVS